MVSRLHRNNCYTFQNTAAVMISGQMMHVGGQVISSPAVKNQGQPIRSRGFLDMGQGRPPILRDQHVQSLCWHLPKRCSDEADCSNHRLTALDACLHASG